MWPNPGEYFIDKFGWFEASNDWLAMQKIENFKVRCTEYTIRVFSPIEVAGAMRASSDSESIAILKGRFLRHETYIHNPKS